MTSARVRIRTSETAKILTFKRNAPTTEGVLGVPTVDCQRWNGLKKRSATTSLPGASTTTTAITAKNNMVLALETSTARLPSIFEPRSTPGAPAGSLGSGWTPGFPLVILLLELLQRPVLFHLAEYLVHATHERVALLEEHPELLVPGILADYDRVIYLEVAQVHGGHQVSDHGVDLAALEG